MSTHCCEECLSIFGWFAEPTMCSKCNKSLCGACAGKYPLVPFDESKGESVEISQHSIRSFCKAGFEETSTLDFSKTVDVLGPERSDAVFVMVHAGGGNRAMFRPHARMLAEAGFKCILPDMPGHGSLAHTELTLESCASVMQKVLDENGLKPGDRVIYFGVCFGAYIGFDILDSFQDYFAGAVLCDCGQNYGPSSTLKARIFMWVLRFVSANASNKFLTTFFMLLMEKKADFHIVESIFGAGMRFDQFPAVLKCMQAVAPEDKIPNFRFPVFFFNGSDDFRDCEDRWLALCKRKEASSLTVFEDGDHFFTHDSMFVEELIDSIKSFAQRPSLSS